MVRRSCWSSVRSVMDLQLPTCCRSTTDGMQELSNAPYLNSGFVLGSAVACRTHYQRLAAAAVGGICLMGPFPAATADP
jgi:hypothetical protein